jgi:bifunctional DNA-binding transcriptional regulator/antitoxin component of YhaV-PrlF toxin-antitoxin module
MTTLVVSAQGQVTFREDVLRHLGIQPGEKIELDLLPNSQVRLKGPRRKKSWDELRGMLKGKGNDVRLSIEDINDAIAEGAAKAGMTGLEDE